MTRALLAVGALLALFFAILGLVVFSTRTEDRIAADNILAEDLGRAIALAEQEQGGEVDLVRIAPFAWDRVLVVAPGTPREDVSAALGSEYKGDIPFGSRSHFFVFARGSEVARIADYRFRARFEGFDEPVDVLPRAESTLRVEDLVVRPG
jgi:hypothetical protein